jgi:uncharacterized membrane protein YccF (DUF307 family)
MSAFSFLLNLLWILFGGLWLAAGWVIAAILMAISLKRTAKTRAYRERHRSLGHEHPPLG